MNPDGTFAPRYWAAKQPRGRVAFALLEHLHNKAQGKLQTSADETKEIITVSRGKSARPS
jgi:hypothetical protein